MHPNPTFRTVSAQDNLGFARERGFGVLAIGTDGPPLMAHIPFVISKSGQELDLHLMRSNPLARVATAGPQAARLAVNGPDAYVSPDWYKLPDQVPTWNYLAVHLTGTLHALPDADLPALLDRLSRSFERRLLPKTPWRSEKMGRGALERMMRMIQPFRLKITEIDGTWKLGQNKPEAARISAADHIGAHGIGGEPRLLAAMMKSPPRKED